MIEILTFMAPAIVMCILLAAICGYVGIHVVMREVIFIDIALAQIAALGTSFAIFWDFDPSDPLTLVISLGFTLLSAFILSGTRRLSSMVPQEAFIGILYATGAAAVLLAGDRLPHGSEYVHDLMCGHLLWVNWGEVGIYSLVFIALGAVYFFLHKKFLEVSNFTKQNGKNGFKNNHLVFWDFVFYALLGILVTFAVKVAGVLLVFGFLIVPAVIGTLLSKSFLNRLLVGWAFGVLLSLLGSYFSYSFDFPTGATVVVTLGLSLFLVALVKGIQLKLQK
ncbi:metal ABC transporter permease [Bacteroidota bacterium]